MNDAKSVENRLENRLIGRERRRQNNIKMVLKTCGCELEPPRSEPSPEVGNKHHGSLKDGKVAHCLISLATLSLAWI